MGEQGKEILNTIQDESVLENPTLFTKFILISYADLKEYDFVYWFCFPVLHHPLVKVIATPISLAKSNIMTEDEFKTIQTQAKGIVSIYDTVTHTWIQFNKLISEIERIGQETNKDQRLGLYIRDSGTLPDTPGWIARNIIYAVSYYALKKGIKEVPVEIIFIREQNEQDNIEDEIKKE
ncbi:MAG: hypothetical protein EZS28_053345, partial [Streblomastix strix]